MWILGLKRVIGVKAVYMYDPKLMVSQVVQEMWF